MYEDEFEFAVIFSFKEVLAGIVIILTALTAIAAFIYAMFAYATPVLRVAGCAG